MVGKNFWPTDLAIFYPHRAMVDEDGGKQLLVPGMLSAVLLLGITGVVVWQLPARPYLAVGWFWFALMLGPMSGLSQAGYHAWTDRFTYIPSIGLYVMVVGVCAEVTRRWLPMRWIMGLALFGACVALGVATYKQVATWRDSKTTFEHALSVTSRNYLIHYNLGVELTDKGYRSTDRESAGRYFAEAETHFEAACEIMPSQARLHVNLGKTYEITGRKEQALAKYREAHEVEPGNANAYQNLRRLQAELGQEGR